METTYKQISKRKATPEEVERYNKRLDAEKKKYEASRKVSRGRKWNFTRSRDNVYGDESAYYSTCDNRVNE